MTPNFESVTCSGAGRGANKSNDVVWLLKIDCMKNYLIKLEDSEYNYIITGDCDERFIKEDVGMTLLSKDGIDLKCIGYEKTNDGVTYSPLFKDFRKDQVLVVQTGDGQKIISRLECRIFALVGRNNGNGEVRDLYDSEMLDELLKIWDTLPKYKE